MKNLTIIRKLFVLLFLIGGVCYISFNSNISQANTALACCYECDDAAAQCEDEWNNNLWKTLIDCYDSSGVTYCYQHCSYDVCDGQCTIDEECPPGQVCNGNECI